MIDVNFLPETITAEYDITTYEVYADINAVSEIYPYSAENRQFTGYEDELINPDHPRVKQIADELRKSSDNYLDFARQACDKAREIITGGNDIPYADIDDVLDSGGDCGTFSSLFISLLSNNGIPAGIFSAHSATAMFFSTVAAILISLPGTESEIPEFS